MSTKMSRILGRCIAYFVLFVLPFIGMGNCEGWSTRDGLVRSCIVDFPLGRFYAEFYYFFVFFSSLTLLVPVFVYVGVGVAITEIIVRLNNQRK